MTKPPVGLTIAGTDPSGGAGIQADIKTFGALGVFATSIITAVVAQATQGVSEFEPLSPEFLRSQWRTLVDDVRIDVIKIGMLANAELTNAVGDFIDEQVAPDVVLDPVMVAASGDTLLGADAIDAVRALLPKSSLMTPNLPEGAVLLDESPAATVEQMREQAHRLHQRFGTRVLLKGGHLEGARNGHSIDVYVDDEQELTFEAPWVNTSNTHGTGCSLSSAIAARRAHGDDWGTACRSAKEWLTGALAAGDALEIGHGSGPVHHFYQLWPTLEQDGGDQ